MQTEDGKVSKRTKDNQAGEPGGVHRDGLVAPLQDEGVSIDNQVIPIYSDEAYLGVLRVQVNRDWHRRLAGMEFKYILEPETNPEHLSGLVLHLRLGKQVGEIPKDGS